MESDPKTQTYPLLIAYSGREAQLMLCDPDKRFAGIFVSPTLQRTPNWISVIRCAYQNRPATPIYMILPDQSESVPLDHIDLKRLGIKDSIEKPVTYGEITKLVSQITLTFDVTAALEKSKANSDAVGEPATSTDQEFTAIRADDFLSGTDSLFDVYVRMSGGKYIKLLQAGDAFTPDRLENYLRKGVVYFYIRKEVQEIYMGYCDHLASALLKSDRAPIELKTSQTLNQGEETMKHLKENGVSDSNLKYAEKFVGNVNQLANQLLSNNKKNDLLSTFMANASAYDHGVGTSMLAGILANSLGIETQGPAQIIGMGALFHDIALVKMPEKLWEENESIMTREELTLYQQHPKLGAEALSAMRGFSPSTIQAIEQHHMRIAGKGFPKRTGSTIVSRVADIIGVCSELNNLFRRIEKNPDLDLFTELEQHVFPGFSMTVVNAVKQSFYPKQSTQGSATANLKKVGS